MRRQLLVELREDRGRMHGLGFFLEAQAFRQRLFLLRLLNLVGHLDIFIILRTPTNGSL